MSPQPISIDKYPVEASGAAENLVFGEAAGASLVIPKTLMTALWGHVREGIRSLTRGGLEVGGLLVGRRLKDGSVLVQEIVPVPIEYRQGPSFHMSPTDLASLGPAVESVHKGGKAVVGFYRSRTRGEETLRESDLVILEAIERAHASYREDFRCCFILAPRSLTLAMACVALRDKAGWTELEPVPLQSNPIGIAGVSLPAKEKPAPAPVAISNIAPESRLPERLAAQVELPLERPRREGIWWYSALGVVAAAAIWLAIAQMDRAPSASPQETGRAHLGFTATRDGSAWKLTWDRSAMDTLNPIGGVLSIDDGAFEQQVPLTPPDLASGTLFYTPQQSGSLTFSLRIDRGGSHVEEHVRVVVAPVLDQPPKERQRPDSNPSIRRTGGVAPETEVANRNPAPSPEDDTKSKAPPSEARADRTVKSFRIPASQTSKAAPANGAPSPVEAPPGVDSPAPQPPRLGVLTVAIPVPPPEQRVVTEPAVPPAPSVQPPATASTPSTSAGNTASREVAGPVTPAPAATTPTPARSSYVPPKVVQQSRPQLPANMPTGVSQVQLLVEIDARGRVLQATPIGWSTTNAPLVVWAIRAVSSWVFEPARLDGKPVQSQMNLIFKF